MNSNTDQRLKDCQVWRKQLKDWNLTILVSSPVLCKITENEAIPISFRNKEQSWDKYNWLNCSTSDCKEPFTQNLQPF
ncbi:hypothetical protein Pan153_60410 [Gimesia panareensis]|uniref:Uncharacterized protein n=1 Tax=Gimesia panareensis TaxID=2527978 RepID=A0A518FYB4_9PLAN|nr:hypothetical protein Pan153_60410 [Gimesia panareensis]